MRRIVARGEVKVVEVNGLRRIPDAEVERLRQVLGRSEQHAWQRKEQRARQLDQQRLAVEERRESAAGMATAGAATDGGRFLNCRSSSSATPGSCSSR